MTSTSPGAGAPGPEDACAALARVSRLAAGAGVLVALLTVAFLCFVLVIADPPLGAGTLTAFGLLVVGALSWSAVQVTVGRWVRDRGDAVLLMALSAGLVAVVVGALGAWVVVGTSAAAVLVIAAAASVAVAETVLVVRVGSAATVGAPMPPMPPTLVTPARPDQHAAEDRVEDESAAAIALRGLAYVAVSFGTGVGLLAMGVAVLYAPVPDLDFDVLIAIAALGVALVAVVWTLPHLALLRWLGRKGTLRRRSVLLGALATAAVLGLWPNVSAAPPEWWLWAVLAVTVGLPLVELLLAAVLLESRPPRRPQ